MKKKNRSYRRGFISIINETRIMQESQCSSSLLTDMNQQEGREDFVEEMVDGGEHDKLIGSDDEKSVVESSILHIYKHADLVEKIIPEFDILKEIVRYEENLKLEKYIEDGNVLLHPNLSTTKIQFSRGLNEYFEKTQTFEKNRTLLVNFLANTIGGVINLPTSKPILFASETQEDGDENIQEVDDPVKDLFDATVKCDLEQYTSKQSRFFSFDQCLNDCTLYLGKYKHSMRCRICRKPRFRSCTQRECGTHGTNHCSHLLQNGSAYKQLHYRPIIIMIYDLLSQSHFHKYLNYGRAQHNSTEYSDFLDGELARGHLKEMEDNFNAWVEQDRDVRGNAIMVNLLFSEFYDSGQLFKSYVFDFWPLCIGILNLPPNLRGKVGLSYFLTAVYGGKHTEVEKVLFNDLVCDELRCLYEGIEHDVNGAKYFIQARMVMHILDTKAAEPCMGYQSNSNSHFGCSNCGGVTGIHNGRQCIFLGNRNYLPQLHVLRFFGQTGRCCPKSFYNHLIKHQWFHKERFHHLDNGGVYETFCADGWAVVNSVIENTKKQMKIRRGSMSKEEIVASILSEKKVQEQIDLNFTPCDRNDETKQTILNFLFVDESQYDWFHTGEFGFDNAFDVFRPFLYYRHQDYRTRKPYRRVTYMEYLEYARQAEDINSRRKAKKKSHIHGIQGLWYWARLQYGDLETQFTWPFVHAISGVVVKVLQLIISDLYKQDKKSGKAFDAPSSSLKIRRVKIRSGKESKKRRRRKNKKDDHSDDDNGDLIDDVDSDEDQYVDVDKNDDDDQSDDDDHNDEKIDKSWIPDHQPPYNKRQAPYQVPNKSITDRVQSWLDCVILPPNVSDDWNVSLVSPSSMKIAQKLKMVLCYWDFVMESINIHKAYQKLFRMLGHDLSMMLAASIDKSKVGYILYCVIETVATWEGMMPGVANSFQLHELVDLPVSIAMYGPPVFVGELPGERMMNTLKNWKLKVNIGGNLSFLKSIMRKEVNHELAKMRVYAKIPDRNDPHFSINPASKQLIYNGVPFAITHPEPITFRNHSLNLNEYEVEFLCHTLYAEVIRRYADPSDCNLSAIYRIFTNTKLRSHTTWVQKLLYMTDEENSHTFRDEDVKVANALLQFKPSFYKEALIYGTHFYSRGSQCRELEYSSNHLRRYGVDTFSPSNTNTGQWFDKHNTRSWCKFQCGKSTTRYGLLNAFFDVKSIGDQSLNGLLLASMTTFKYTTTPGKVERVSREESFDNHSIHFVALQDIFPTQVCTIPFLNENTAISIKNTVTEVKIRNDIVSLYDNMNIKPSFYVMIMMHPDRLPLQPGIDERPFTKFMFRH
jgi:hypothetical protein